MMTKLSKVKSCKFIAKQKFGFKCYIHKDFIPSYRKEETEEISFSGKRENRLYKISGSSYVNADLNGSANIGRKAFSEYTCTNLLNSEVIIVKHPDKYPDGLLKSM